MLVDDGERHAARIGEHDIARAVEPADGVAHAVVEIVVDPHAGCRDVLEEDRLDVPVVVEAVRHVELEARRVRQHDAAARVHPVDVLADFNASATLSNPSVSL